MYTPSAIALPGYRIIELIYDSTRTLVYRGQRTKDQKPVAIKLLRSEYPSFNELVQFRNQYSIAKNLDLPGIIKTYSLENCRNGYALVMEDMGGISLKQYTASHPLSLAEFLALAIQIVSTLEGLYRHRVIHKDIKPGNILINPTTLEVRLIDFSIASLLPREAQVLTNPNVLEGTLPYLSPEQTGRMNRGIDYRTDFYSLGITFYELLTGRLPFSATEPMELVYSHLAKQPDSVHSLNPSIPPILSDIVGKLMAKNAEDRYQSALGLKQDLETCLHQWNNLGNIPAFELGKRDISDCFIIPEKLYGRHKEVETLLAAFDRVAGGKTEMMLVAGFSGIGKTAVVNEIHKPIVRQRGYFIKGKFDQFQRNIPFSAFVQAFRDLMAQLLSESDTQIAQWKTKILSALGENGQVIIDVIPELERIIGKQPPVPELSGSAAQNRFNLLFEKFIQIFSTKEHPLVIFLDDLQWADSASLKLMQLLMSETDSCYLLLIGAYRDNEVSPAHPLMLALEEIRKIQATVNTITLAPLKQSDLNHLIADTLNCPLDLAFPLTQLIHQKTKGNPFFANQFLKSLYENRLIIFNFEAGYWQSDIVRVRTLALTDDVVEFMALQLQKLPASTQTVLQLAACIGNQFDLETLAIVQEKSPDETAADLWKALQEGLILPLSEIYKFFQDYSNKEEPNQLPINHQLPSYKFLHDRVQQAAYSLIPENQKQSTHLKIGQQLLNKTPEAEREEKIFAIVNQLNIGVELIALQTERDELAQLNLMAGRKARNSTAYAAAVGYFTVGISILPADCWQTNYQLTRNLYEEAAEAAYLDLDFERMEQLAQVVLQQAKTPLEKVKVYHAKIQAYGAQNKAIEAVNTTITFLKLLGIYFPENTSQSDIQMEREKTISNLASRGKIEDLIHLPEMTDPCSLAAMGILASATTLVYQAVPELFPLIIFKQINLSVTYGNAPLSAFAYVVYGLILCGVVEDIESGYQFGKLAENLLAKFHTKAVTAKVIQTFNCLVRNWKDHIRETLKPLLEAYSVGLETGDLEFAALSLNTYCYAAYFMGRELTELQQELTTYSNALWQIKQERIFYRNEIYRQIVLNWLGYAENPCCLIGEAYDEEKMLPLHFEANDTCAILYFYFGKLQLCYLLGNYPQAIENAAKAEQYLNGGIGQIVIPQFHFYDSLTRLAVYPDVKQAEQEKIWEKVAANQEKMKGWAHHAPANFMDKFYLVEAERHRVLEQKIDAINCYNQAIALAKENEYIQEEALANELIAKFYLGWGREKIAQVYLTEAYYAYARWGATAKVDDLEKRYPQLLAPILQGEIIRSHSNQTLATLSIHSTETTLISSNTKMLAELDLASVIKASQTLSGEIQLDKLIATLMQVVLENAGAQKCVLVLPQGDNWVIEAIAQLDEAETSTQLTVLQSEPVEESLEIPKSAINYVKRTLETLVIQDATAKTNWAADPYMHKQQPKSVLCGPILNQGKLIGILYLENNLIQGAFTTSRIEILNLLCAQAAISLENARLYQTSQQLYQQSQNYAQQLEKYLQELQQTQLQLIQSEKMSALGNLVAGVAHEINNPVGFISGNIDEAIAAVKDLTEYLELYHEKFPNPGEEIAEKAEEIELEYLLEDLPKMLSSMKVGCDRIRNISTSLRTFSRADSSSKVAVNLHEGIDSTLMILRHRLKANENRPEIQAIKVYGNIPAVKCYPGQLNQVFMNILANAIDALEESNSQRSYAEIQANPNQITIKTEVTADNQQVAIKIRDNGLGMSEEIKARIFDHLFTTKSLGKGTGLGLSISRQIVQETHGGSLTCESVLGQGTEFTIWLPIE
ncbi:trifunctional serine/threonine-protein kinase/ATP-binding protein/sensor histidine kinase [Microseira wollei]|uniref:histidine kinase n=1 Tax=Microseira wollei NIES-4236 TaxID=2530354 RepID=A0AAV3X5G9_9CYAN|nr:ATP-binding sensor histidine kinase [Microseira wollei]GET36501.1 multi-sensor signal transduction multi-kinase [Microseira wollei NIES-4236]